MTGEANQLVWPLRLSTKTGAWTGPPLAPGAHTGGPAATVTVVAARTTMSDHEQRIRDLTESYPHRPLSCASYLAPVTGVIFAAEGAFATKSGENLGLVFLYVFCSG